ncbi:MAG: UDP-N-acetylmuramoyl-L-alanine--D-glutamate ligase, partial [Eubacteriales bacterium]|nr:UDP-N-acetylmuramoyl-L-alanine--D-glutamate ligase [Eubacteriales bacterium]
MKTEYIDELKKQNVLVVGFGRSGKAAAKELAERGVDVTVQDSSDGSGFSEEDLKPYKDLGVKFMFGTVPEKPEAFQTIVLSPGVTPELPFVVEAASKGSVITGELELAYELCEGTFVAITGTNGKTTTTSMVGDIFKKAGRKTDVVGNIGVPVMSQALTATSDEWLVTECSSFQLETTHRFKPVVSAILNLTPDHLNRHHTMEAYGAAKAKIAANQDEGDYLVINYDDKLCYSLSEGTKAVVVPFSGEHQLDFGAFVKDGDIVIKDQDGSEHRIIKTDELRVIGYHNVMNALAAAAVSFFAGVDPETIGNALREFPGVEHRIEYCGEIEGVKYYNDSKGTNVDAAVTAIKAVGENIILIAGGDAKGQDFTDFVKEFPGRVKKMILLGRDAYMI